MGSLAHEMRRRRHAASAAAMNVATLAMIAIALVVAPRGVAAQSTAVSTGSFLAPAPSCNGC